MPSWRAIIYKGRPETPKKDISGNVKLMNERIYNVWNILIRQESLRYIISCIQNDSIEKHPRNMQCILKLQNKGKKYFLK